MNKISLKLTPLLIIATLFFFPTGAFAIWLALRAQKAATTVESQKFNSWSQYIAKGTIIICSAIYIFGFVGWLYLTLITESEVNVRETQESMLSERSIGRVSKEDESAAQENQALSDQNSILQ